MKRRQFIQATASSLLVPIVLSSPHGAAVASSDPAERPDRFFFDDRFASARHAADAANSSRVDRIAVQGDVTPFWVGGIDLLSRRTPLILQGVTTESFRFCLHMLLRERAEVRMQVMRADSNLLLWTMHSTPIVLEESVHG